MLLVAFKKLYALTTKIIVRSQMHLLWRRKVTVSTHVIHKTSMQIFVGTKIYLAQCCWHMFTIIFIQHIQSAVHYYSQFITRFYSMTSKNCSFLFSVEVSVLCMETMPLIQVYKHECLVSL